MKCPRCESASLRVEIRFNGSVSCFFFSDDEFEVTDTVAMSSEWDEKSRCECTECAWAGHVAQALSRPGWSASTHSQSNGELTASDRSSVGTKSRVRNLKDVEERLQSHPCDPQVRECLEFLSAEIQRLQSMLELVKRANAKDQDGGSPHDTVVL